MEDLDKKYMAAAIEQAIISKQNGDVPFGAVVVQHGRIIAAATNSEHLDHDVTKHAEVKAVSAASRILGRRDLSDCTIYSTVEPCPMCAGAIFHACISRVVFGMSRDDLPTLFRTRKIRLWDLAKDWHYKPEVVGGILSQEAVRIFLEYKEPFRVIPKNSIGG
jgi:tRNA(Arg) A34 adenosine deaminase TadA